MQQADPFPGWLAALRDHAPAFDLVDAHTHIGQNDPDGFKFTTEQLIAALEAPRTPAAWSSRCTSRTGIRRPTTRCSPRPPDSDGVLTPFCRLDPRADPLAEAERCLAAGAAGIKLHPRAEDFPLDADELDGVFALAHERRLPVLVHAGRGIPALGRHAVQILERYPDVRLILAHAGICDLAWIWRAVDDHPNLFFDTVVVVHKRPAGAVRARAAAQPPVRQRRAVRHAVVRRDDEPAAGAPGGAVATTPIRLVFGGQMTRILDGEEPADAGPAPGPGLARSRSAARSGAHLPRELDRPDVQRPARDRDPRRSPVLPARSATTPRRRTRAPPSCDCSSSAKPWSQSGERFGRPSRFAPGLPLVVAAAGVVRTPDVPMPPVGAPAVDVGERAL